jgi:hypothetical protein
MSMNKLILFIAIVCLSGPAGLVDRTFAQTDGSTGTAAKVVRGDVLDQEGEYFVIKDISGHETRIHVNKDTKTEDRIKVGDKIEAQVNADGHANSIRIQLPDAMPSPSGGPKGGMSPETGY